MKLYYDRAKTTVTPDDREIHGNHQGFMSFNRLCVLIEESDKHGDERLIGLVVSERGIETCWERVK